MCVSSDTGWLPLPRAVAEPGDWLRLTSRGRNGCQGNDRRIFPLTLHQCSDYLLRHANTLSLTLPSTVHRVVLLVRTAARAILPPSSDDVVDTSGKLCRRRVVPSAPVDHLHWDNTEHPRHPRRQQQQCNHGHAVVQHTLHARERQRDQFGVCDHERFKKRPFDGHRRARAAPTAGAKAGATSSALSHSRLVVLVRHHPIRLPHLRLHSPALHRPLPLLYSRQRCGPIWSASKSMRHRTARTA